MLYLRGEQVRRYPSQRPHINYPIRLNQPDCVVADLIQEIINVGVGDTPSIHSWVSLVAGSKHSIKVVSRRDKPRQKRYATKLRQNTRRPFITRQQWIFANVEDMREDHLVRLGETLERSTERLHWYFKRISNWEKDQHVTALRARHVPTFPRTLLSADQFASEWTKVLGRSHRTAALPLLSSQKRAFAFVPPAQRLTNADNTRLFYSHLRKRRYSWLSLGLTVIDLLAPMGRTTISTRIRQRSWFQR